MWLILSVVLLVVFVALFGGDDSSEEEETETIDWSKMELGELVPEPPVTKGEVHENSDEELWIRYKEGMPDDAYNDYLDACINAGYTIDPDKSSSSYKAYNEKGYYLDISHFSRDLSLELKAPMEMGPITWPTGRAGQLLPPAKSQTGKYAFEDEDSFALYLGETPKEDYDAYVTACSDQGFTVDYSKGDDFYMADNRKGWHLDLSYKGNSIMFVRIDPPGEDDE